MDVTPAPARGDQAMKRKITIDDDFSTTRNPNSQLEGYLEDNSYITPNKTVRLSEIIQPKPTKTANKYKPLENWTDEIERTEETTRWQNNDNRGAQQTKKTNETTCSPLVICGKPPNHNILKEEIKKHVSKGFYIKYTQNNTLIYLKDKNEFDDYKRKLKNQKDKFHAYSTNVTKTHAFVLKGMQADEDLEQLKDEITSQNIQVKEIYRMKTKSQAMYLIVTENYVTIKELQNKIKYLNYTRIRWERKENQRPITQVDAANSGDMLRPTVIVTLDVSNVQLGIGLESAINQPMSQQNALTVKVNIPHAAWSARYALAEQNHWKPERPEIKDHNNCHQQDIYQPPSPP